MQWRGTALSMYHSSPGSVERVMALRKWSSHDRRSSHDRLGCFGSEGSSEVVVVVVVAPSSDSRLFLLHE